MNLTFFFNVGGPVAYLVIVASLVATIAAVFAWAVRPRRFGRALASVGVGLGVLTIAGVRHISPKLFLAQLASQGRFPEPFMSEFNANVERISAFMLVVQLLAGLSAVALIVWGVWRAQRPIRAEMKLVVGVGACVVVAVACLGYAEAYAVWSHQRTAANIDGHPPDRREPLLRASPALAAQDAFKVALPGYVLLLLAGALAPYALRHRAQQT